MAHRVLTETAVSISELKKNPMVTVAAGEGMAVAVLNRNEPAFYCVPAKACEELMDLVEDLELGRMADARLADGQEPLRVSLDALCAAFHPEAPPMGNASSLSRIGPTQGTRDACTAAGNDPRSPAAPPRA